MAVEVKKDADGNFEIKVDDQTLSANAANARLLLAHLAQLIRPETASERSDRTAKFLDQLGRASDTGIQGLLRTADHDDILVLLKIAEDDETLHGKLYANMTGKSAKIFAEDVAFKYDAEIPGLIVEDAVARLIGTAKRLVDNGTMSFSNPAP